MSYRVRYTFPDGRTGHWMRDYATREEAQRAIDDRHGDTGLTYSVEKVPDAPDPKPNQTSTTERLVATLREHHKEGMAKYGSTVNRGDFTAEQLSHLAVDAMIESAGYMVRILDTLVAEAESLNARIHRLEEAGDAMCETYEEIGMDTFDKERIAAWKQAKEQTP